MGSWSIWHWLIVLLILGSIGGGLAAIARAKKTRQSAYRARAFSNQTIIYRLTVFLLSVFILICCVGIISNIFEYSLLLKLRDHVFTSSLEATSAAISNDGRQSIISVIRIFLYVSSIICFCAWMYCANANAHALGAKDMEFTPGWSVGWYFVPIACLGKPFAAMVELWKTSADISNWKEVKKPSFIGWWWIAWLATGFSMGVTAHLVDSAQSVDDLILLSLFIIVQLVLSSLSACLLLLIVRRIQANQLAAALLFEIPPEAEFLPMNVQIPDAPMSKPLEQTPEIERMMTPDLGARWWYSIENAKRGPVTTEAIQAALIADDITRDTPIWQKGMTAWMKLVDVAEFHEFIACIPPPLTKAPAPNNPSFS